MASILDYSLPEKKTVDWGKVGERVAPAMDFLEGGFLKANVDQQIADEQARKNYLAQQTPSPLMIEPAVPVVATPQVVEPTPQVQEVIEKPKETPQEQKQVADAYTEGKKQAAIAIGAQDELAKREQAFQEANAQKQKAWEEGQKKAQEADAEVSKIEPKDYWADKSTGSKIAAAIAMGLGAYASAMTGTQNAPMQIINDAITRDMNLQKEKYQRAKERGATIKSQYADIVARLGDQEAAELTLLNNAYKKMDQKLQAQALATTNQVQLMNIQKMRQEILTASEAAQAKRAERLALSQLQPGKSSSKVNISALPKEVQEKYVQDDEFSGLASSFEEAKEFRKTLPQYKATMRDLNRLLELAKMQGKSITPSIRGEIEQIKGTLGGTLREDVLGPGTVNPEERKILQDEVIGDPTKFMGFDSVAQAKIRNLANKIQAKKADQAAIIGLTPSIKLAPTNTVQIKIDGKHYEVPYQNLEPLRKAMEFKKKKFEVIGGQ